MDINLNELIRWIVVHAIELLIGVVILAVIYRIGTSAINRIVPAVIGAQASHLPSGSSSAEETQKRITTIQDLLLRLLRVGVLAGFVIIALAVFDLWAILGAIVLILVAVTFATRDVVLDYVMGFLNLIEGPYFKGDYITVRDHAGLEGTVEEIGLRRTTMRDAFGSVHAVSNGLIRASTNMTRMFSIAVVDFQVLHAGDLEAALRTAEGVMGELTGDAAWADQLTVDSPAAVLVIGLGLDGATIRIQQRVPAGAQTAVAGELRRRLAAAFAASSVGIGRWDTPLPIAGIAAEPGR
jgi:small-conductance mechanosensitive channel